MQKARSGLLTLVAVLFWSATTARAIWRDPTFGVDGMVIAYGQPGSAVAVSLQPDGKILAAGSDYQGAVVVLRFDQSGNSDATFGTGGIAKLQDSAHSFSTSSMAIQADGSIVVAGSGFGSGSQGFFVARFLTDGNLDPSFGSGGFVTTDFPAGFASGLALAVQTDGKLVVVGSTGTVVPIPNDDFAAARYNSDGSLDPSFGAGGRVVLDLGGRLPEWAKAAVVETDGRIVLGGLTDQGNGFVLAGLLPDGSPDLAFGVAGKVLLSYGTGADCNALAVQSDGKIVAAGSVFPPPGELVVRLFPDGNLDPSFGAGGISTIPVSAQAVAVAVDPSGRIVLAGNPDFVLARLLPDGQLDPSIGPQGWLSAHLDAGAQHHADANALALQPDGKIVLGGYVDLFSPYIALLRYAGAASPIPALAPAAVLVFVVLLAGAGWIVLSRGV